MTTNPDEHYMHEALKEAEQALTSNDRPVGAVMVNQGRIIGRAHHQVRLLRDPTAHATLIAVTQAANTLQSDQLLEAHIYVTQEPCAMCVGALLLSGVARLVYGAPDPKQGACGSAIDLTNNERINRRLVVVKDVLAGDCYLLLRKAGLGLHSSP
ncbi:MAG: nucleoside deaminase [Candidatus Omnitrophica bacterium]|nr:nucleoside deaminase [Candidatus Omnitrophota bacterium]